MHMHTMSPILPLLFPFAFKALAITSLFPVPFPWLMSTQLWTDLVIWIRSHGPTCHTTHVHRPLPMPNFALTTIGFAHSTSPTPISVFLFPVNAWNAFFVLEWVLIHYQSRQVDIIDQLSPVPQDSVHTVHFLWLGTNSTSFLNVLFYNQSGLSFNPFSLPTPPPCELSLPKKSMGVFKFVLECLDMMDI